MTNQSQAYARANGTERSTYEIIGKDPARAAGFADTIQVFSSSCAYNVRYTLDSFYWSILSEANVVDVGASREHVAIALARRYSNLRLLVQDSKGMISGATDMVKPELQDRVQFVETRPL